MATCTRQVVITFDGPLITFVFDTGHRTSVFICCCRDCVSISADAQFLFVSGYVFHKSCITSVGGNASGNLVTYLGLIEDQIVTACVTGAGFDADYQAILDFGIAGAMALPSDPVQTAGNTLMLALKAALVYSPMDTFYVPATDGDSDFATINWVNPATFQLLKVAGPAHSATGFMGDAIGAYLDSQYDFQADGTNWVQDDAGIFYYVRTLKSAGASQQTWGGVDSGNVYLRLSGATRFKINSTNQHITATAETAGTFQHVSRNAAANTNQFVDGVLLETNLFASTGVPSANMTAFTDNGATRFSNMEIGIMGNGANLQAGSEETDLYNAVNAYLTTVGAL